MDHLEDTLALLLRDVRLRLLDRIRRLEASSSASNDPAADGDLRLIYRMEKAAIVDALRRRGAA